MRRLDNDIAATMLPSPGRRFLLACVWLGACSNGGSAGTDGAAGGAGSGMTAGAAGSGHPGVAGGGAGMTSGAAGASTGAGGGAGAGNGNGATTGSAGIAGGTGAAGSGGAGAGLPDGGATAARSAGCGITTTQALASYVKFTESVPNVGAAWTSRNYYVRLPAGYDPGRSYPTVFVGPGCDSTGHDHGIAVSDASGPDAIVVAFEADPAALAGRDCFMTESAMSPEIDYFDETLEEVQAKFCVDTRHVYVEGFSSGSWLTNLLGCARGNVLRGQGNASGCAPPLPTCAGPIAYMEAHDTSDPANAYSCGTANRDRMVKLNGCLSTTKPYNPGPGVSPPPGKTISCVQYDGCKAPVVFCTTTGLGHTPQEETHLSTNGFWNFWTSLP
jgi:polyhydroxybutyrate depolymerase